MAKNIVGGVSGQMGISTYDNCVSVGTFFGWDQDEARRQCRTDPVAPQKTVASSGDPIYSQLPQRDVNLTWWALTHTTFTKEEKETFINIAGSYIVYRVQDGGEPRMPKAIEPMNDDAFALLIGNAPGGTPDKVKIAWWTCLDAECISMDPTSTTEVTPFTTIVENRLFDIRNKLATSTALTTAEIAFINTTTLPVWKMLTLGYSAPDSTLSDLLIQKYKTVIAYDYAQTFMRRALKEARFYLGQAGVRNAIEEEKLVKLLDDLSRRTDRLTAQYIAARQGIRDMNAFTDDLQSLERSLMTAIPFRLKSSLDFSGAVAKVGR
jgi:conjugative transfer pilus assembly protein TraH